MPSITLVTPTCDRPEAFALCERWLARQSVKWDQWLVLDDGAKPARCTLGQEHVRDVAAWSGPLSLTLKLRWLAAHAGMVRGDVVVFVEDDDWYSPEHLAAMLAAFDLYGCDLAGEGRAIYYHVGTRQWCEHGNLTHASLCATAMRRTLLPELGRVCGRINDPFADVRLWAACWSRRVVDPLALGERTCIGIKGMPGKAGYGMGHRPGGAAWREDAGLVALTSWLGADANAYAGFYEHPECSTKRMRPGARPELVEVAGAPCRPAVLRV